MLFVIASALAFDSEPQPVRLEDTAALFDNAEFSTGFVPSGSPVAVEFRIQSLGGAGVSMDGTGDLTWPDALTLAFTGEAGSGVYILDASLDAVTTVAVDLSDFGYYGTFEIDRRSLLMDGATFFDPFVLDTRVEVSDTTDSTQLIYYSYEIFAGVSLAFEADMTPVVTAGFEGVQWGVNEATIASENEAAPLSFSRTADFGVDGIFRALWDARFDIVFAPALSVCAPFISCIEIVRFDIPIEIVSDGFEQDFPLGTYSFPLPWLQPDTAGTDFGDVTMGSLANAQVGLENVGSLSVFGTATITGSTDFTVFPTDFNALPGTTDGLVVTFAPTLEGPQTANLVLSSNDPAEPDLLIPLTGNTPIAEATDEGGDVGEDQKVDVSTCGCSGTAGAPSGAGLLALLLGLVWRGRRSWS